MQLPAADAEHPGLLCRRNGQALCWALKILTENVKVAEPFNGDFNLFQDDDPERQRFYRVLRSMMLQLEYVVPVHYYKPILNRFWPNLIPPLAVLWPVQRRHGCFLWQTRRKTTRFWFPVGRFWHGRTPYQPEGAG